MREYTIQYDILSAREDGNYIKVRFSNLSKSMAQTLGISLKRILLNEIEGTAPRGFCIQNKAGIGLKVDNVVEDTTEIMLNLSELRVKRLPDADGKFNTMPFILHGSNNGKDKITFGDLSPMDEDIKCEILNKDMPLLHLGIPVDDVGTFNNVYIKVMICDGIYFTPRNSKLIPSLGVSSPDDIYGYLPEDIYIEVNSVYQPVENVNFKLKNATLEEELAALIKDMQKPIDSLDKNKSQGVTTFHVSPVVLKEKLEDIFRKTSLFYGIAPVLNVEFSVDDASKYTEILDLEIETNGTVTPFFALESALDTLKKHISRISAMVSTTHVEVSNIIESTAWKSVAELMKNNNMVEVKIDEIPNLLPEVYNELKDKLAGARGIQHLSLKSIYLTKEEFKEAILGKLDNERILQLLSEAKVTIYDEKDADFTIPEDN